MEMLAIIGLGIVVYYLWQRLGALERQLAGLQWLAESVSGSSADNARPATSETETEPSPEPADLADPPRPAHPLADVPDIVPSWQPMVHDNAGKPASEEIPESSGYRRVPLPAFDFEDIFGRRLPIWAGGIALALAGIFLVRFSIEAGLVTPRVRVILSFVFGLLLLAGAEAAYRFEHRVADPRVRQALAGAGLATLYAGFYLAGSHYGLIGSTISFLGLAAVTAAAIALSFRFGLPSAVLGLVGGFAAPALVASEEANVPLLTLYLALVTAGLAFTGRRQHRPWLGFAALAGGLLWGMLLLLTNLGEAPELLAFGIYLTALGALLPILAGGGPRWHAPRLIAAGLASLQMAALVDMAGYRQLTWGLYLLLAAALAVLCWRDPRLRESNAFVAALGIWLLLFWQGTTVANYAPVTAGMAAVFVAVPLAITLLGKGRKLDLWQLALAAPALAAVTYAHFGRFDTPGMEPWLALATAAFAAAPAAAAWHLWRSGQNEPELPLPLACTGALTFAALLMLTPAWAAPLAAVAVAGGLAALATQRRTGPLLTLVWCGALVCLVTLCLTPDVRLELLRSAGLGDTENWRSAVRWAAAAAPFLALAWIEPRTLLRTAAEALLALCVYLAAAQLLPADSLAWLAALGAIAVYASFPPRFGGWGAPLAVTVFWALMPLGVWLEHGLYAFGGDPMLLGNLPAIRAVLLQLLPLAVAAGFAALRSRANTRLAASLFAVTGFAAFVVLHVAYKHLFALTDLARFQDLGLAERTVWQGLLCAGGIALLGRGSDARLRYAAACFLGLSLAHFGWFTVLLHNPLWAQQEVGAWPLLNWLLAAYAVAAAGLIALQRQFAGRPRFALACDALLMALIAVFAVSELRQAFSGSLLVAVPMSQTEDLLRSLLGIVLAIGFLAWGSRHAKHSWRVGSLVLMLLAVGKVFLVDTAGLEGLLRVASFMALGFSLIGIGWVYSRQLIARRTTALA
jgi:uncharacterized membrane protein